MDTLKVNKRLIMTPGPVSVDPRVSQAMSNSILGQFDYEFVNIMNETMSLIRQSFLTENKWAFPIDGTSRAGLEAVISNIVKPGDEVLVPVIGRFGYLFTELVTRAGGIVHNIHKPMGEVFDQAEIIEALDEYKPKVLAIVHGETSTGRLQPIDQLGRACKERGIFSVVDAVATYQGMVIPVDEWELDAVVGGAQKCLSIPSGITPITFNERFSEEINKRKRVELGIRSNESTEKKHFISSNYLDLTQLQDYWSPKRLNHHTESTTSVYALYTGLKLALSEGIEARAKRHSYHQEALKAALKALGLEIYGDESNEMKMVICVKIPEGIDDNAFRNGLLQNYGVEIAGSFGDLQGQIWRIGIMGYGVQKQNILTFLSIFSTYLVSHDSQQHLNVAESIKTLLDYYEQNEI
ncbi:MULTISPECIES: pyridoxal-phosphate-dependent aminotransferase family protein [Mammaliicoccus]|uniref:pyridoxal-phosphate-dependent aminotransferase family protein n=1 Tax=Mammaliicoccus TaxID=2803850 RepID=UPI00069DD006|nr:alanine--glyoxylate aminotransferase family protein [Mammaliicoccus sciuri]MBO1220018.1 alanine--glyoxylate aminotransferase family protein [Mammaliicoccus sciuri]MBO1232038.1 alanine--glyoxylate aminotransferase family protein [Mammaliicoccus sciuri]PNY93742.1 alanine--glyoxylate aminotransferase family protein [Mammaliicoccus sciuri]PTK16471.1 alanine--glyoxylate aminotransferase family protein [Mammaliicoccus sciuri]WRY63404.1 alanine--glyoxylate aminotransferase family protein [Mammalii